MKGKIIKIVKNILIFVGAIIFISIWMGIFQELTIEELQKGNLGLSNLLRVIKLLPLLVFIAILAKKIGDWRKKKKIIYQPKEEIITTPEDVREIREKRMKAREKKSKNPRPF